MSRRWIAVLVLGAGGVVATAVALVVVFWSWFEPGDDPRPPPRFRVGVLAPGLSSDEMSADVCAPLSDRVGAITGVMQAVGVADARAGACSVHAVAEPGTDGAAVYRALHVLADEPVATAASETPSVSSARVGPVLFYALTGAEPRTLADIHGERLVPALEALADVEAVGFCGDERERLEVRVEASALAAWGLTLDSVSASLSEAVVELPPGGTVGAGGVVRVTSSGAPSIESLGATSVATAGGATPLARIATIDSTFRPSGCTARADRAPVVAGRIALRVGADVDAAREMIASIDVGSAALRFASTHARIAVPAGTREEEMLAVAERIGDAVDERGVPVAWAHVVADGPDPLARGPFAALGQPVLALHLGGPLDRAATAVLEAVAVEPGVALVDSPGTQLTYFVTATDRHALPPAADEVGAAIRRVDGVAAVAVVGTADRMELATRVDPERARRAGTTAAGVQRALSSALRGQPVDEEERVWLFVGSSPEPPDVHALATLAIPIAEGRTIPLGAVADLAMERAPGPRLSLSGAAAVALRVAISPSATTEGVSAGIEAVELPAGIALVPGGS